MATSAFTSSQLRSVAPAIVNRYNEALSAYNVAHKWLAVCSVGNCESAYLEADRDLCLMRAVLVQSEMEIESALGISRAAEVVDGF